MKTLKLSFFALLLFFAAACMDDDDTQTVCAQSDWVGTYTGTVTCDGEAEDVTVTIAADGTANIEVEYMVLDTATNVTVTTSYDPLPFTNCTFSEMGSGQGITGTVMASLNGNEITLTETLSDSTTTSTCQIVAIRN